MESVIAHHERLSRLRIVIVEREARAREAVGEVAQELGDARDGVLDECCDGCGDAGHRALNDATRGVVGEAHEVWGQGRSDDGSDGLRHRVNRRVAPIGLCADRRVWMGREERLARERIGGRGRDEGDESGGDGGLHIFRSTAGTSPVGPRRV